MKADMRDFERKTLLAVSREDRVQSSLVAEEFTKRG